MPRQLWTVEQAREMGKRSAISRAKRKAELANLPPQPTAPGNASTVPSEDPASTPFARKLMHAQEQTLAKLLQEDDAKAAAALSQALRNLRETYHLVTGRARPGILRDDGKTRPTLFGARSSVSRTPTGSVPPPGTGQ